MRKIISLLLLVFGAALTVSAQTHIFCAQDLPCQFKNMDTIRYVDATNSAGWAGSDIGGWINSAYADLPLAGGMIIIGASTATINYSTPIVFNTVGKPVILDFNGQRLNFTPLTPIKVQKC